MALSGGAYLTGYSDALLVTSVLNSLGVLIHRRPAVANKVLNSVLNFNPLKLANSPMTPRNKVSMKAIERTTRALLVNILKRYALLSHNVPMHRTHRNRNAAERPNDPNNGRIQHFLERMHRMRQDIMEETSRKRPAPVEPTDGLDPAKRQRLGPEAPAPAATVPPLPPGPVSYRQLFTIDPENAAANFDVKMFQDPALVQQILIPILQSIDENKLLQATKVRDIPVACQIAANLRWKRNSRGQVHVVSRDRIWRITTQPPAPIPSVFPWYLKVANAMLLHRSLQPVTFHSVNPWRDNIRHQPTRTSTSQTITSLKTLSK
jgi:hypothetical protein